jgi:MerR family transcriptional regulator/heat shock protein HspR
MARAKKSQGAYVISVVAERFQVHPQTLRLYEREGLLKPSRTEGNTRLYTDGDLERLELILNLTRDLGVNLAGVEIVLNMRERMSEMQRQMQAFVNFVRSEMANPVARDAGRDSKALVRANHPIPRVINRKPQ